MSDPKDVAALTAEVTDRLPAVMRELNATPAFGSVGTGYPATTALLLDAMRELGLEPTAIPVPQEYLVREWGQELEKTRDYIPVRAFADRAILLARIPGRDPYAPSLHLSQHYDLPGFYAPAGDWDADSGDSWIRSAGANQCRGGVLALLAAAGTIAAAERPAAGDVYLSFTPDNHLGGETGAGFLVEENIGRSPYVITGGASGPSGLVLGYKGAAWIRVTVHGQQGLASQPHLAINAIDKMRTVQNAIAELGLRLSERPSAFPARPEAMRVPTITQARIDSSGLSIPERCVLYVDRRLTPEESMDSVFEEFRSVVDSARLADPDLLVDVDLVHAVEGSAVDPGESLATLLATSIQDVLGVVADPFVLPYYTEHRLFTHGWGAQVVGYGPGRSDASPDNDILHLEDIRSSATVIALAASRLSEAGL